MWHRDSLVLAVERVTAQYFDAIHRAPAGIQSEKNTRGQAKTNTTENWANVFLRNCTREAKLA